MADKYLNYTGLSYYHSRIKTQFADKDEFDTVSDKVDELIAEGGEPNVIETISVNGTNVPPTNKNIDLDIPTATSDLTNDGDGESPFATEDYVDENGGKIDVIKVNDVELPITSKAVNIDLSDYALAEDIPTAVSELTNDSGFITKAVNDLTNYYLKSETYTQAEVDNLIGQISTVSFEIVQSLPQTGQSNIIYLLANSGTTPNVYDEYIWINNAWEKIGSTAIDLSNYWTSTSGESNSLIAITTAEIDTIVNA